MTSGGVPGRHRPAWPAGPAGPPGEQAGVAGRQRTAGQRPAAGEVSARVRAWHRAQHGLRLREALGWTLAEYAAWVRDAGAIPCRPLPAFPPPAGS